MTKGPLTPPIVLYRIRGVTLYEDGSRGSPMLVSSEGSRWTEADELQRSSGFSNCRAEGCDGRASCRGWGAARLLHKVELPAST